VFCKLIFSNKLGFILETVFSYTSLKFMSECGNISREGFLHEKTFKAEKAQAYLTETSVIEGEKFY
jgi:hypothetical protein